LKNYGTTGIQYCNAMAAFGYIHINGVNNEYVLRLKTGTSPYS